MYPRLPLLIISLYFLASNGLNGQSISQDIQAIDCDSLIVLGIYNNPINPDFLDVVIENLNDETIILPTVEVFGNGDEVYGINAANSSHLSHWELTYTMMENLSSLPINHPVSGDIQITDAEGSFDCELSFEGTINLFSPQVLCDSITIESVLVNADDINQLDVVVANDSNFDFPLSIQILSSDAEIESFNFPTVFNAQDTSVHNLTIDNLNNLPADYLLSGQIILAGTFYDLPMNCIYDFDVLVNSTNIANETITTKHFELYPNPANDNVNIEPNYATAQLITIRNTQQQVVFVQEVTADSQSIDLSHLAEGAYFISLEGENKEIQTQSLIIQR